ncbi:MAG: hypothetical protein PHV82_01755 [Victivallaceae bacterium]|nr:hypothetical protein [Victivallaceae bacterium]
MNTLKYKSILFIFVGIFLYISQVMLYREITANSNFPFCAAVFFLLFFALWTAFGITLAPFERVWKSYFLFPLICISPATLLSLIAVRVFAACYPIDNYSTLAFVSMFGCFPAGTLFGILLASVRRSVSLHIRDHVLFWGATGYLATGLFLYPLALFNIFTAPFIYTLTANVFIIAIALAAFKLRRARTIKYRFLIFAVVLAAVNFALFHSEKYAVRQFFANRYPGWQFIKSYFTHHGRISEFSRTKNFMLLKNDRIYQRIPDDCELYKTTAVPFSLQPNKKNLHVLAVSPPFSHIPLALSSLPYVRKVTMLAPGRDFMPLTLLRYFSPQPSAKLTIIDSDLGEYLRKDRKFDLIIWLFPDRHFLNFDSLLKLCAANLKKDGTLALPASLIIINGAQTSLKELFKNRISIPGKSLVYAFSNFPLCPNLNILEKRLEKLDDQENKLFPAGTFSILYSIPGNTPVPDIPLSTSFSENLLLQSFVSPQINLHQLLAVLIAATLYGVLRFFLLRRKSFHAATGLFENGLCTMLLMMLLTASYALYGGEFYYDFGTMLAVTSGVPAGIFLSRFKLRRSAVILSIIIIFLCVPHAHERYSLFIPFTAYLNFLCGGIIAANIFNQNPAAGPRLQAVHFSACAIGAALMFTLLIMRFNIVSALFIVFLFRIPLIFSKMTLGKLDIREAVDG